ncbi:hypothetical protein BC829DRAFT_298512 [Chytridium lagenaria]|nr:hypothetical protein BC829DRAFT_298512 [Chytridium lagenaria]
MEAFRCLVISCIALTVNCRVNPSFLKSQANSCYIFFFALSAFIASIKKTLQKTNGISYFHEVVSVTSVELVPSLPVSKQQKQVKRKKKKRLRHSL